MKAEELMIKPSDLRLGNWVMYDNRYFQISMIADVFPELNTTEFGIGVVDYNNISAIPLSEEVLLKCGFEKGDFSKTYVRYSIGNFNIIHDTDKGIFICDGIKYTLVCVEYLHQLQNLYYALTGEELEVKWS